MKAKDRHRLKLLEYLGNPENDFPNRVTMNTLVLGFKNEKYIYHVFTPDELTEIEGEALKVRRKKYKPAIAKVDKGILEKAAEGDAPAAKLCYQRFENWSEKKKLEIEDMTITVANE